MSDFFHLGNRKLVPLKDVTKIVPYSKDYVARLARDGRVAAAQINRQWYIDAESLKNFFEHAQLEVQARTAYTRALRKEELDLHAWWTAFTKTQQERQATRPQRVMGKTIVILILGMLVGLFVTSATPVYTNTSLASMVLGSQSAAVSEFQTNNEWYQTGVIVEDESFKNPHGILLTPESTVGNEINPETLFSDPVTVEMTSPTAGVIYSSTTSSTVPFVKIPQESMSEGVTVTSSP